MHIHLPLHYEYRIHTRDTQISIACNTKHGPNTHTLSLPLLLSLSLCVSEVRSFVRFGCCMRLIATLGTRERIEFVFIHLRQNVTHDNIFQPNCVRQLHYIKIDAHTTKDTYTHTHICTTEIKRCEGKNDTRWQIDRGERLMQFV